MKEIAIYNIVKSPGVRVIIDHLLLSFEKKGINLKEVSDCNDPNIIYIPYGPKCAYNCARMNRQVLFDLMVDYLSLGCRNRSISLFKNGYIFTRIFWRELASYFLNYYRESVIYKKFERHFFVSYNDILRVKKRYPQLKCYYVPNGCTFPAREIGKTTSKKVRLGVLSNWTKGTLADVKGFIEKYLPIIKNEIPDVELYIAGKCTDDSIKQYFEECSAIYLGWVDSLDDFFANLDIYIATVPKGCGILNKVLDAFAHKTFTIGHINAFSGFYGLNNGYVVCNKVEDYICAIKTYCTNPNYVFEITNNAYQYVKMTNNWELIMIPLSMR